MTTDKSKYFLFVLNSNCMACHTVCHYKNTIYVYIFSTLSIVSSMGDTTERAVGN